MWTRRILFWVLLFLWGILSFWSYHNLSELAGQVGFYYTDEPMTRGQLETFWGNASEKEKKEIQDIVLYRIEEKYMLSNCDLNRTTEAELVELAGNMQLAAGDCLLQGNFVAASDRKGCVLSKETAYQLFGTVKPIGETIWILQAEEERIHKVPYEVRGVLNRKDSLCMIQSNRDSYPYIRVKAKGVPLSLVKQRLAGLLPGETSWYSESDFYIGIGCFILSLPLWVLLYQFIRWGRQYTGTMKTSVWREVWKRGLVIVGIVLAFGIVKMSIRFSEDYIPTAWSDFEFWGELFRQKIEMIRILIKKEWHWADGDMFRNLGWCMCCSVMGIFTFIFFKKNIVFIKLICYNSRRQKEGNNS